MVKLEFEEESTGIFMSYSMLGRMKFLIVRRMIYFVMYRSVL